VRAPEHVIDSAGRVAIAKSPSASWDTWNITAWEKVALDRFDCQGATRIGYASAMSWVNGSMAIPEPTSLTSRPGNNLGYLLRDWGLRKLQDRIGRKYLVMQLPQPGARRRRTLGLAAH